MVSSAKRKFVSSHVIGWFSDHFHLPFDYFGEKTSLRDDLLFDNASLVELGKYFNKAAWTEAKLYPSQYAACETIGDLIDLITEHS
ncbi:hypothetical protein NKI38_22770 [Mesorhizobium sp. M0621]|uniref:hypothetical protein n=1 Tax=Mesorhizobium sp. M0621 TaxID=2956974 RepID=UPI00333CB717